MHSMSKRKLCASSLRIVSRERLFTFLLKREAGRKVGRVGSCRGAPAGRDGITASVPSSVPSPCNTVSVVKYGKARGKTAFVHAKT